MDCRYVAGVLGSGKRYLPAACLPVGRAGRRGTHLRQGYGVQAREGSIWFSE